MPKPGFFKFTGLKVRCWFVCRWDCSSGCSQVATCCLLNRNLGTCTSTTNVTDRQRTNKLSTGPFSIHRWGVAGTGRVSNLCQATKFLNKLFRQNLKVVTFVGSTSGRKSFSSNSLPRSHRFDRRSSPRTDLRGSTLVKFKLCQVVMTWCLAIFAEVKVSNP